MNDKENKYRDYLPENRYKRENPGMVINPKILNFMLAGFWLCIIVVAIGIGLHFYGIDILKVESREYNMNMLETINLDNVYMSSKEEVIWESNSDNVTIENNVATVVKNGDAYIIGRIGNKQVSDLKINVLSEDEKIRLDSHSIDISTKDNKKVEVIQNNSSTNNSNNNINYEEDINDDDNIDNYVEPNYTYSSSDESIAKVDDDGNITPISSGTTVIIVEDDDGNKDHAYVTVNEDDFSLYTTDYNLNLGNSTNIEYKLNEEKYNYNDITWSSMDPNIVRVDNNGTITGIGVGTTTIIVDINNEIENQITVTVSENIVLPSSLSISSEKISLTVGNSFEIKGTIFPEDATDKTINWTSDDENIATVDKNGKIIGKSVNSTTIHATTSNGIRKDIEVTVKQANILPTNIKINEGNLNLNIGDTKKLTYTIEPSNTTNKEVTLTSSNPNIVNIDNNGNVIAISEGTANITATLSNNLTSTITVTVNQPIQSNTETNESNTNSNSNNNAEIKITKLTIDKTSMILIPNETATINAIVIPNNTTNKKLSWTSSNPTVATVDSKGKINAKSTGNAVITVKTTDGSNLSQKCTIKVINYIIESNNLKIDENKKANILKGQNIDLSINHNEGYKNITWKSSNPKIVSIDNKGTIKGIETGTANITAKITTNTGKIVENTINITVLSPSISFKNTKLSLEAGSKTTNVVTKNQTTEDVTYKSSNTSIATINEKTGEVTGIKAGTTTITATTKSGLKATYTLTITQKTTVKFKNSSIVMNINTTQKLDFTINPTNVSSTDLIWQSSDTNIATVSSTGTVTSKKTGNVIITVKGKDGTIKATCTVKIISLKLNYSSRTIMDETSTTLKATTSNIENDTVVYTSSNSSIATVDSKGNIRGKKSGKAIITATLKNSKISVSCNIIVRNINILFVGNSKTLYPTNTNGIPGNLSKVLSSAGYNANISVAATVKLTLKENYIKHKSTINKAYDYVILQEQTTNYTKKYNEYLSGVRLISNMVTNKNKNVKIYIRKTWIHNDTSLSDRQNTGYKNTDNVVTALQKEGYNIKIIPDGTAMYYASNIKKIEVFSDERHQNGRGAYLVANCIGATIFNINPNNVKYVPDGMYNSTATNLKNIAKEKCYDTNNTNYNDDNNNINSNNNLQQKSLTLNYLTKTIMDEDSFNLKATTTNTSNDIVVFSSNDTSIATVDQNGKVTGKKVGKAVITAKLKNSNISATCTVTVRKIKVLFIGDSKTGLPSNVGTNINRTTNKRYSIYIPFYNIAKNGGYDVSYSYAVKFSTVLSEIYNQKVYNNSENNLSNKEYINSFYDYVVFQQLNSQLYKNSGDQGKAKFFDTLDLIAKNLKQKNPNVKMYVRKVWMYDTPSNTDISITKTTSKNDINLVNNATENHVKGLRNLGYNIYTIEDGAAMYYKREQEISYCKKNGINGDICYYNEKNSKLKELTWVDYHHQSKVGTYLIGNCIYAKLFGKDPRSNTYKPSYVSSSTANTLRIIAKNYCYNTSYESSSNNSVSNSLIQSNNKTTTIPVTSINTNISSKTIKYKEKFQINTTVIPSNATNKSVLYSSSDTSIATVDSKGQVTAKSKMGKAFITITSKSNSKITKKITVSVVPNSGWNGENKPSYKSLNILGTLNLTKQITVARAKTVETSTKKTSEATQGFCVAGDYYISATIQNIYNKKTKITTEGNTRVVIYNKKTGKEVNRFTKSLGHANDFTYNPYNKNIYLMRSSYYQSFSINNIKKSNLGSTIKEYNLQMPDNLEKLHGAIAYDKDTRQYYFKTAYKIYVYNENFKLVKSFATISGESNKSINDRVYRQGQGIAAYHGLILVLDWRYEAKSPIRNRVAIYRISDGSYLGSFNIKTDYEVEGIDYYGEGNKFAIQTNGGIHGIWTTTNLKL